jgi:Uma2 family endonuclease
MQTQGSLTAEEFARLPEPADGSKLELVRGVVVPTSPTSFRHGEVQLNIAALIKAYARAHKLGRTVVESGLVTDSNPGTVRGPDVSFWSAARMGKEQTPVVFANVAPDLCVEVVSPGNSRSSLQAKVREYFKIRLRLTFVKGLLAWRW